MLQPRTLLMALPLLLVVWLAIVIGPPPKKSPTTGSPGVTPTIIATPEAGQFSCSYTLLSDGNFILRCATIPS